MDEYRRHICNHVHASNIQKIATKIQGVKQVELLQKSPHFPPNGGPAKCSKAFAAKNLWGVFPTWMFQEVRINGS